MEQLIIYSLRGLAASLLTLCWLEVIEEEIHSFLYPSRSVPVISFGFLAIFQHGNSNGTGSKLLGELAL